MSHMVGLTTSIRDVNALIRALGCMDLTNVTQHKTAVQLKDYWGRPSQLKGNVIVPRGTLGLHADMGFELMKDGTYMIHADHYDTEKQYNGKFNAEWQTKLFTRCNVETAKIAFEKKKMKYVEDVDDQNRIRLRARI